MALDENSQISLARMHSQLLIEGRTPADVVSHFGALQGQDLPGVLTSIALRTPDRSVAAVIDAFNNGELVRTWPQRGTLHVVSSYRLRDLLVVARERTFRATIKRREALGIDEEVLERARTVALESVGDGVTRAELTDAWDRAGLIDRQGRAYHLIFHLSIEGLLVWGPFRGKEQLIVLVDKWVPQSNEKTYDEIVDDIVRRYVISHSPTTRKDASWWANLPLKDIDRAIAKAGFVLRDGYVWAGEDVSSAPENTLHLLPGFDEMILGYSDRSATVPPENARDICPGNNGVFKPTIIRAGTAIGTWQRTKKQITFFDQQDEVAREEVNQAMSELPL